MAKLHQGCPRCGAGPGSGRNCRSYRRGFASFGRRGCWSCNFSNLYGENGCPICYGLGSPPPAHDPSRAAAALEKEVFGGCHTGCHQNLPRSLESALLKAGRALDTGVDLVSGFSLVEILDWLEENEPFDPITGEDWRRAVKAFLRRSILRLIDQKGRRNKQVRSLRARLGEKL